MLFRRITFSFFFLTLSYLSFGFQLGYFFPERHAEVLQKGDSVLSLKARQRPEFLDITGYPSMPLDRLLSEYYLQRAAFQIDKTELDSAISSAKKAIEYSEGIEDEELKLVALVTAGKIDYQRKNSESALAFYDRANGLKASKNQEIYRLWNLYNVLTKSEYAKNGYGMRVSHEMLLLAKDMETDALRLWYVYLTQRLAKNHRERNQLDSASFWFEKAEEAAKKLPKREVSARVRLAMVQSRFFLKNKEYPKMLAVLTDIKDAIEQNDLPGERGNYMRRWYRLTNEASPEFIAANKKKLLYTSDEVIKFFRNDTIKLLYGERIKGLDNIIHYESLKENWKFVAEVYSELRVYETKVRIDDIKNGFNKRNELLQASTKAQEKLSIEQLQTAKLNQRFYALLVFFILVFTVFIYRSSRQHKKQNLVLSEKSQLIQRQKEELEQLGELKSKFFTNISHELRTPLTLILGNLKNVINQKYGTLNERQTKSLAVASANSNRILGLVQDMLDLSKIESGKEKISARKVDLENEAHAVLNLFDVQLEDKSLEVEVRGPENTNGVYVDQLKLETILFNLISNAVKHSHANSLLKIEISEDEHRQSLSVCNQGDGIPSSELPYVFDRFFQAGSSKSGEGTGVGLALTKDLVDLHKGEIKVTSTLNGSTCFTVSFLKGTDHLETEDLATEIKAEQDIVLVNQGAKLLVVEDNADMRHYLYELLSEKFRISLAENGQDALNRINTVKPDLIITDYMMPEMNGVKFYRGLRKLEDFVDVPVVFLTARAIERDREALLKEGVDDYILKPFNDTNLIRRVAELLSLKGERNKHRATTSVPVDEMENKLLNQLRAAVFSSIQETGLNPATLAEVLSVSERTLYRKVKAATGFSPQAYIKEIRLQEARRLIQDHTYESVSDVAYAVGFEHLSHFSTSYKERFSELPSDKPEAL